MSAMRCWTARPDLLPIYQDFADKIRAEFSLSPRDWRLITFVAAKQVPSTYCSHVYGKQLIAEPGLEGGGPGRAAQLPFSEP